MGASYPDLNRCTYMFADDRRCRNPIETPGAAFCVYHREKKEKEARPKMPRTANRPRSAAAEAFFQWFCHHPLDTATSIHQTLNQVVILLAAGSLSPLEANMYLRACRQLLKTYKDVASELKHPWLSEHKPGGEKFLAEVRESLVPAILADDRAVEDPEPAAAGRRAPESTSVEASVDSLKSQFSNLESPVESACEELVESACDELVESVVAADSAAPVAGRVANRPLTVDAYMAEYLTANLRRQPAVSPDASRPNSHRRSRAAPVSS